MKKLVFAIAFFSIIPLLHAQQSAPAGNQPPDSPQSESQATQEPTTQDANPQSQLPAPFRPGHSLDPADVDVLTGKRDREVQASRRTAPSAMLGNYGEYGTYGDYYWMNGRIGEPWDMPMLPLARVSNPFFFGFGRGGFGGGFGRGGFRGGR